MPYDLGDWLPENHLARFVVDIVDKLDLSGIYKEYKGVGSTAYDPRMLLGLLFYGYSTGDSTPARLRVPPTIQWPSVLLRATTIPTMIPHLFSGSVFLVK